MERINNKFLNKWADIYIQKAKTLGNKDAKEWISEFVPKDYISDVKRLVEDKLGIKR